MIKLECDRFYCIGHRGNEFYDPENTFSAFKRVAESHIDFIETDVQITKDNRFVLFHDRILNKKTNLKGQIIRYTIEKLKTVKYTYFGKRSDPVCTLEELLDFISKLPEPKTRLILELKSIFKKKHFIELISLINRYNLRDHVIIDSFYQNNLKNLRKMSKDLFISLLLKKIPIKKFTHRGIKNLQKIHRKTQILDIQAISIHRDNLIPSIITYFKEKGVFVFGWGIGDLKEYSNYVSLQGLNGFTASDPLEQKRIRFELLNY